MTTQSMRKSALVAGLFYLITFISIPTLAIYSALKSDPAWILGSGSDTSVLLGTVLELIVALAGIGTAVALFPVVRRQSEGFALGFVTTRIVEAAMIFMGVVSILSLVTLQQGLGAAAEALEQSHPLAGRALESGDRALRRARPKPRGTLAGRALESGRRALRRARPSRDETQTIQDKETT